MHLEARGTQCVAIAGRERVFAAGERIHTENSYKYSPEQFAALLRRAGFSDIAGWQDEAGEFAVYYAEERTKVHCLTALRRFRPESPPLPRTARAGPRGDARDA